MSDDFFTGLRRGQIINARNDAANAVQAGKRAREERNEAIQDAVNWKAYALELEELIIEIGSRLEATIALTEKILRAANGELVEHADKLLAADETGEAARRAILEEVQKTSKTGMVQAHQQRLKENPDADKKAVAIEKTYSPQSERFSKIWSDFIKIKTSRKDGPPTPADAIKMRELLLEIGPELIAANNLTLRLLAEGNGQQVEKKLLAADQRDARREYLDAQVGNSREGMIEASVKEIASVVSLKNPDSTFSRQQAKIAGRTGDANVK